MCEKCDAKRNAQLELVKRAVDQTDVNSIQFAAISALVSIVQEEQETARYAMQALERIRDMMLTAQASAPTSGDSN